jgi:hypothetical protein
VASPRPETMSIPWERRLSLPAYLPGIFLEVVKSTINGLLLWQSDDTKFAKRLDSRMSRIVDSPSLLTSQGSLYSIGSK